MSSMTGQTGSPDTTTEGPASVFRPPRARSTLAARRKIDDLVQATHLLRRSTSCPRKASRPFLGHVRQDASNSVSTTDVSRHEHPGKHPLWRPSEEHRGVTRRCSTSRIVLGSGRCRRAENDAGPPRGHPASNGRAFDDARAGFGRVDAPFMREAWGRVSVAALSAGAALSARALWHLSRRLGPGRLSSPFASRVDPFRPAHVNASDFPGTEVPSTGGDHPRLFREPGVERCPAGRRGSRRTCSPMFENID